MLFRCGLVAVPGSAALRLGRMLTALGERWSKPVGLLEKTDGCEASVREADATDWRVLLSFHECLYLDTPARFVSEHVASHYAYREPLRALQDDLASLLAGGMTVVLIAERNAKPIGYITGQLQVDERRVYGRVGLVLDWFVVEQYRGQGVGRLMMEAIVSRFNELGCEAVESSTFFGNACARAAHAALGFTETEVRMRISLRASNRHP